MGAKHIYMTEAELKRYYDRYYGRMPAEEVARKMGMSPSTMYRKFKAMGLPTVRMVRGGTGSGRPKGLTSPQKSQAQKSPTPKVADSQGQGFKSMVELREALNVISAYGKPRITKARITATFAVNE